MNDASPEAGITIIYDGDCPFCSRYVEMVRLRESVGDVRLVDARDPDAAAWLTAVRLRGLDLNDGMVAIYLDQYYHGDECLHLLAGLTSDSGLFNRINSFVFRSRTVSRYLYPVLRAGRNATLAALGREKLP